jgi:hypothetical protein
VRAGDDKCAAMRRGECPDLAVVSVEFLDELELLCQLDTGDISHAYVNQAAQDE